MNQQNLKNLTEEEKELKMLRDLVRSEEARKKKAQKELEDLLYSIREQKSSCVRFCKDFPKEGVNFVDFNKIFVDCTLTSKIISYVAKALNFHGGFVVGPEARGFILGPAIALFTGSSFVPLRKPHKLPPFNLKSASYKTEYGEDTLELDSSLLEGFPSKKPIIIYDDVIATGGTDIAAYNLVKDYASEVYIVSLFNVPGLNGVDNLIKAGVKAQNIITIFDSL